MHGQQVSPHARQLLCLECGVRSGHIMCCASGNGGLLPFEDASDAQHGAVHAAHPPALLTAAVRAGVQTPAIGARTIGYCMPRRSIMGLLMAGVCFHMVDARMICATTPALLN